jgi:hypothetical protein
MPRNDTSPKCSPTHKSILQPNVSYGVNIDFLTSDFSQPRANYGPEVTELQTAVSTSQPIPAVYYNTG